MPIYRVTLDCAQEQRGWSYSWYQEADSPQAITNLLSPASLRIQAFQQVHATSTIIIRARAGRAIQPADAASTGRPSSKPLRAGGTGMPNHNTTPDVVSTTGLVDLVSTTGATRRLSLRGLPDEAVNRDPVNGLPEPAPVWAQAVDNLISALSIPPVVQVQSIVPPSPTWPWLDVSAIEGTEMTDDRYTTLTTLGEHNYLPGYRVITRGVDECLLTGYKGIITVAAVPTPTSLVVRIPYRLKVALFAPDAMQIRRVLYEYTGISAANSQFVTFSSRDTGVARVGNRGRARSRSCRR